MIRTRNRNAWIWVAITAIALASVARAQSGLEIARSYANPVIALLSTAQATQSGPEHFALKRMDRGTQASQHESGGSLFLELLPILFVGLLSPLSLLSARSWLSLGHTFAPP